MQEIASTPPIYVMDKLFLGMWLCGIWVCVLSWWCFRGTWSHGSSINWRRREWYSDNKWISRLRWSPWWGVLPWKRSRNVQRGLLCALVLRRCLWRLLQGWAMSTCASSPRDYPFSLTCHCEFEVTVCLQWSTMYSLEQNSAEKVTWFSRPSFLWPCARDTKPFWQNFALESTEVSLNVQTRRQDIDQLMKPLIP